MFDIRKKWMQIDKLAFRHIAKYQVFNVETLQGVEDVVECFGFDAKGEPIQTQTDSRLSYKFSGGIAANVCISANLWKDPNITVTRLVEAEIQGDELEKQVELLAKSVNHIYLYRKHYLHGMPCNYFNIVRDGDKWVASVDRPVNLDLDAWNTILQKKLKSPWRVYTPKARKLARFIAEKKLVEG